MIKFGEKPKCVVCNLPAEVIVGIDCYCLRHKPKKREKIGKYSGRSETPYGDYPNR